MATNKHATAALAFLILPVVFFLLPQSQTQTLIAAAAAPDPDHPFFSFSFPSSHQNTTSPLPPELQLLPIGPPPLQGSALHLPNSTLCVLPPSALLLYRSPIKFTGRNPGFSTYFSFSPSLANGSRFAFFLTLSSVTLDLLDVPPPALISLTFITSLPTHDTRYHLELHLAGLGFFHLPTRDFLLHDIADKLHSWIDYNGTSNQLQVTLATSKTPKPQSPIVSHPIDLSNVLWRETMVVGFTSSSSSSSSSTDNSTTADQNCTLYQWLFVARHGAPYLMHSEPLDPNQFLARPTENPSPHIIRRMAHPWGIVLALIFAAACGAMVTFFAVFVWFSVCAHRPVAPVEYPAHPADVVYEKIMLVRLKDVQNK